MSDEPVRGVEGHTMTSQSSADTGSAETLLAIGRSCSKPISTLQLQCQTIELIFLRATTHNITRLKTKARTILWINFHCLERDITIGRTLEPIQRRRRSQSGPAYVDLNWLVLFAMLNCCQMDCKTLRALLLPVSSKRICLVDHLPTHNAMLH